MSPAASPAPDVRQLHEMITALMTQTTALTSQVSTLATQQAVQGARIQHMEHQSEHLHTHMREEEARMGELLTAVTQLRTTVRLMGAGVTLAVTLCGVVLGAVSVWG